MAMKVDVHRNSVWMNVGASWALLPGDHSKWHMHIQWSGGQFQWNFLTVEDCTFFSRHRKIPNFPSACRVHVADIARSLQKALYCTRNAKAFMFRNFSCLYFSHTSNHMQVWWTWRGRTLFIGEVHTCSLLFRIEQHPPRSRTVGCRARIRRNSRTGLGKLASSLHIGVISKKSILVRWLWQIVDVY